MRNADERSYMQKDFFTALAALACSHCRQNLKVSCFALDKV